MKITALIENLPSENRPELASEHGLSLHIQQADRAMLFDTGATGRFALNAQLLGIDLADVSIAFLSHGHYDHTGGLLSFLQINRESPVFAGFGVDSDMYFGLGAFPRKKYIGTDKEVFSGYSRRIRILEGFREVVPDVSVISGIPGKYPQPKGNKHIFARKAGKVVRDDFDHEIVVVMKEDDGLVVFTGCSHSGILNMIWIAKENFPGVPIKAVFGGFHLIGLPILNTMAGSVEEVRHLGRMIMQYDVGKIYTCHCTGKKAFGILKEVMRDRLEYFSTGSAVEL